MKTALLALLLTLASCSFNPTYHYYDCKINADDVRAAAVKSGLVVEHSDNNSVTASLGSHSSRAVFSFIINENYVYYTISEYSHGTFIGYAGEAKYKDSQYYKLQQNISKYCKGKFIKLKSNEDFEEHINAKSE